MNRHYKEMLSALEKTVDQWLASLPEDERDVAQYHGGRALVCAGVAYIGTAMKTATEQQANAIARRVIGYLNDELDALEQSEGEWR